NADLGQHAGRSSAVAAARRCLLRLSAEEVSYRKHSGGSGKDGQEFRPFHSVILVNDSRTPEDRSLSVLLRKMAPQRRALIERDKLSVKRLRETQRVSSERLDSKHAISRNREVACVGG